MPTRDWPAPMGVPQKIDNLAKWPSRGSQSDKEEVSENASVEGCNPTAYDQKRSQRDPRCVNSKHNSHKAMGGTSSVVETVHSGHSKSSHQPSYVDEYYTSRQTDHPSPSRMVFPTLHSLPPSSIFERSVQEDILPIHTSPSIPSHISVENHIPPVLEASSVAITDDHLDPDSVEIITHSMHQSATAGVSGALTADQSLQSSWLEGTGNRTGDWEEPPSPHKAAESADVRRLSFISFADVVNAEHAEATDILFSRESSQAAAWPGNHSAVTQNRTPSPLRSPISSHGLGTSPATSISNSFGARGASPSRGSCAASSPRSATQRSISPSLGGELNIETMRQALRRTRSGELRNLMPHMNFGIDNDRK